MLKSPHILYTDSRTTIAHAQYCDTLAKHHGSQAVRLLLVWLAEQLHWQGALIEDEFPYYWIHKNSRERHFVCFSHSCGQVALIVSTVPCAIDLELRPIKPAVAKRFFHTDELCILEHQETRLLDLGMAFLWQLKESYIKLRHDTLSAGLGRNCTPLLLEFLEYYKHQQDAPLCHAWDNLWLYHHPSFHLSAITFLSQKTAHTM